MVGARLRTDHMVLGISAGAIASCILLLIPYLDVESSFMLVIFNFLFVSLIFPLEGTLPKKLCMLVLGNVVGLAWNYVFFMFAGGATGYLGGTFEAIYTIVNPLLNLVWLVSFWSLSLAAMSIPRKESRFET